MYLDKERRDGIMGKVYVSQESSHIDYAAAKMFGETRFVTDLEFSLVDNSLKNEKIISNINDVVAAFDPLNDYIVLTGSPITFGLIFHKLASRCQELDMPLRILLWDRRMKEYKSATLNPEELKY